MSIRRIADRLVELCREGRFEAAQSELFDDDALSIEPDGAPFDVAEGLEAIRAKGREFMSGVEQVHGVQVSEAIVAGNHFTLSMSLDLTRKGGARTTLHEICVYEVVEDKIVCEQFFYTVD